MAKLISSPSRQYVAMCNKSNFDGFYFRKFTLPATYQHSWYETADVLENSTAAASWYFLNVLNFMACVENVIPLEDMFDFQEQK